MCFGGRGIKYWGRSESVLRKTEGWKRPGCRTVSDVSIPNHYLKHNASTMAMEFESFLFFVVKLERGRKGPAAVPERIQGLHLLREMSTF